MSEIINFVEDNDINEILYEFLQLYRKKSNYLSEKIEINYNRKKIILNREISEYIRINTQKKKNATTKIDNFNKKLNKMCEFYNINILNYSEKAKFITHMIETNIYNVKFNIEDHTKLYYNDRDKTHNVLCCNAPTPPISPPIVSNQHVDNITPIPFIQPSYYQSQYGTINNNIYYCNGVYYKIDNNQMFFNLNDGLYYHVLNQI